MITHITDSADDYDWVAAVTEALENAFKEVTTFDPDAILRFSLPLFGFHLARQESVAGEENVLRFKEHFSVGPSTVSALLSDYVKEFPEKF